MKRRFLAGVVLGAVAVILTPILFMALLVGGVLAYDQVIGFSRERGRTVQFLSLRGRDVSAAGGTRVMAELEGHVFRQDCRDACDDIESEFGPAKRVRVLAADGRCVLCEEREPWAAMRPAKRWIIGGAEDLRVTREPFQ